MTWSPKTGPASELGLWENLEHAGGQVRGSGTPDSTFEGTYLHLIRASPGGLMQGPPRFDAKAGLDAETDC